MKNYDPFLERIKESRPSVPTIHLKRGLSAKELLWRGITAYEGGNAKWLKEYDEVADWLTDNKHKGLMLAGNCGLGKTLIAMHILPVIFQNYCEGKDDDFSPDPLDIKVYSATDLNEMYRNEDTRRRLFNTESIMIDDVGTEPEINIFGERHMVFSEIVDHCEKNGRLLVMTTNLTAEQIQAHYDMRIRDRLRYLVRRIGLEGKSLRK